MHRSCEWISGCCKKDLVQPWLKPLKPSSSSCICWIPGIHGSSNSCRGLYWALMGSNCFLHCYLGKQSWKRIILYTTTLDPGMGCHYPQESLARDDFGKGCGRTWPFRLYSRTLICCNITGQDFEWFGILILIWSCLVSESTRNPFNADVEGW